MQPLKRRARVSSQFLGKRGPDLLVTSQCVRLPAAAVKREHVLASYVFIQRVLGRLAGKRCQQLAMLTATELDIGQVTSGCLKLRGQHCPYLSGPGRVQAGERLTAPGRESLLE